MNKPLFPLNITDLHISQPWWNGWIQQTQIVFDCGCWVSLYRSGDNWYHERRDCLHRAQG
jgi:hypothetical protein